MPEQSPVMEAEFTLMRQRFREAGLRGSQRYRCPLATLGRMTFAEHGNTEDVWVQDLSKIGVGLSLNRPLEVGTSLLIRMKADARVVEVGATVAHSTQLVDASWRIGCVFDRKLSPDELEMLL